MNIVIVGANSAIAKATARLYAEQGHNFFLVGRNEEGLHELTNDLQVRGAGKVAYRCLDVMETEEHAVLVAATKTDLDRIDLVLICHGSLPDQQRCENDFELAQRELTVNGTSVVSLAGRFANELKTQGHGVLAVVTSVAGDRGRQPNYLYGAAKSLVSTYLQGLRGRLLPYGVHVVDIRPGLVDSPMTAHLEKGPLWATPEQVASKIVQAIYKQRHTVYAPGYWRLIMAVVRSIPDFLFKRLKF